MALLIIVAGSVAVALFWTWLEKRLESMRKDDGGDDKKNKPTILPYGWKCTEKWLDKRRRFMRMDGLYIHTECCAFWLYLPDEQDGLIMHSPDRSRHNLIEYMAWANEVFPIPSRNFDDRMSDEAFKYDKMFEETGNAS